MKKAIGVLAAGLLAGCSSLSTHSTPEQIATYKRTIPECQTETECDRMWSTARRWILDNSQYRLRHVTDDYLETYPARGGSSYIAFRATKERTEDGHRIVGEAWCDNMYGCNPVKHKAMIDFNRTVAAAGD